MQSGRCSTEPERLRAGLSKSSMKTPILACFGQSNLVGKEHGLSSAAPYTTPRTDIKHSYYFKNTLATTPLHESGAGTWEDLDVIDSGGDDWWGPWMSCSQRLVDLHGLTGLRVVSAGVGSSKIDSDLSGTPFDEKFIDYLQAAVKTQTEWEIVGIYHLVIETYSNVAGDAAAFETTLRNHYAELRSRLNQGRSNLPIVQHIMTKAPNGQATAETNQQVIDAARKVSTEDPWARRVETIALPQESDDVHFTAPGLLAHGEQAADHFAAMRALL